MNRYAALVVVTLAASLSSCNSKVETEVRVGPDVLFIVVDDLNDWVGYLDGHPQTHTPNIDRLASMGVAFTNAHCQGGACNSSRASFVTGRYPFNTGVYRNESDWSSVVNGRDNLFSVFRNKGYEIEVAGKILHYQSKSFTNQNFDVYFRSYAGKVDSPKQSGLLPDDRYFDWGTLSGDAPVPDVDAADWVIQRLEEPTTTSKFIAWGLLGPHLPWYGTEKWMKKFPLEQVQVPETKDWTEGELTEAGQKMAYGRGRDAVVKEADQQANIVQAYLACVAHADEQIGRVLDALESSGRLHSTIIVLTSDHGMHFGEKNHWEKATLWERTTHVPLIIVSPEHSKNRGKRCDNAVGLVSILPTLGDLADLEINDEMDGVSLVPYLQDPDVVADDIVFTCNNLREISARSNRYRLVKFSKSEFEFYDYKRDPKEWKNAVAEDTYSKPIRKLKRALPKTWADRVPNVPRRR